MAEIIAALLALGGCWYLYHTRGDHPEIQRYRRMKAMGWIPPTTRHGKWTHPKFDRLSPFYDRAKLRFPE